MTRARFDGRTLALGHWMGGQAVACLELRRESGGAWQARASRCGVLGSAEQAAAIAWGEVRDAFLATAPDTPCSGPRRWLWPLLGAR